MDSYQKVYDKQLPPRNAFYSRLTGGTNISQENYEHAQKVWRAFDCETLGDYTLVYVSADVYQLAEAVMELRNNIFNEFGLDLVKYLSLPMLAKDLMLKFTGTKIELLRDMEMISMVKDNIRGGLSFANHRYFDQVEESKAKGENMVAIYVDANNLYGGEAK